MNNKSINKFHWRSFVSFFITLSGIIIFFTGIILYLTPSGRVAYWNNWKLFGLTKVEWQSLHTIFSFTFSILAGFHIYFNWNVFMNYIRSKARKTWNRKYELLIASVITVIMFVMTLMELQPFKSVMDFGEYLTDSWENEEEAPPVPHAEAMTLPEFAEAINIDYQKLMQAMSTENITVNDTTLELKEIAEENNMSPNDLFNKIKKYLPVKEADSNTDSLKSSSSSSSVETPTMGSGFGRKTLNQIADELQIPLNDIIAELKKNGIDADPADKLRSLSEQKEEMTPLDIYEIIKNSNKN